jgi:hypothetical protein
MQIHGLALPDCRLYEQVSPVEKDGADAKGYPGRVEAAVSGRRASYYSISPFPGGCRVNGSSPVYLSSRAAGEAGEPWGTEGLLACEAEAGEKLGLSEDLSLAEVEASEVSLAAGASPGCNAYVRYTEPPAGGERYRWLAHTAACGGEEASTLWLAGFSSDDQRLLVESEEPLTAGSVAGAPNAFEANLAGPVAEQWSLVGVIPAGGHSSCTGGECVASAGGSVVGAGAYQWPQVASALGEEPARHFTQSAISQNGSRVYFTALPSGRLYLREVDAGRTVAVSGGAAHFYGAVPDGRFAFYVEGGELFRFDAEEVASEPIAVDPQATGSVSAASKEVTGVSVAAGIFHRGETLFGAGLPSGEEITSVGQHSLGLSVAASETHAGEALSGTPADVVGVLGSSTTGSVVYFAAGGRFAEDVRNYEYVNAQGEREHASEEPADEGEVHQAGSEVVNLYEWHQSFFGRSRVTFIARLENTPQDDNPNAEGAGDEEDWSDFLGDAFPETKTSRVSPVGRVLLFKSRRSLTGYVGDSELFRYSAGFDGALGRLLCISCNPEPAQPAHGDALLDGEGGGARGGLEEPWLTRNLSANGNRVLFETPDPLVNADVNSGGSPTCISTNGGATGCDVYEWEAYGEGSCASIAQDGGCLYLISSGTSSEQSYFGDASANGNDVFFFTRQALAPTDDDDLVDVYDAHECLEHEACEG